MHHTALVLHISMLQLTAIYSMYLHCCASLKCTKMLTLEFLASVLYCTLLYCCIVLYCTVLLYCNVLYCTDVLLYCCTVLYCTAVLHCTVLYCCTVMYCTAVLYCTDVLLYCCTVVLLYCTVLYCTDVLLYCCTVLLMFCTVQTIVTYAAYLGVSGVKSLLMYGNIRFQPLLLMLIHFSRILPFSSLVLKIESIYIYISIYQCGFF